MGFGCFSPFVNKSLLFIFFPRLNLQRTVVVLSFLVGLKHVVLLPPELIVVLTLVETTIVTALLLFVQSFDTGQWRGRSGLFRLSDEHIPVCFVLKCILCVLVQTCPT